MDFGDYGVSINFDSAKWFYNNPSTFFMEQVDGRIWEINYDSNTSIYSDIYNVGISNRNIYRSYERVLSFHSLSPDEVVFSLGFSSAWSLGVPSDIINYLLGLSDLPNYVSFDYDFKNDKKNFIGVDFSKISWFMRGEALCFKEEGNDAILWRVNLFNNGEHDYIDLERIDEYGFASAKSFHVEVGAAVKFGVPFGIVLFLRGGKMPYYVKMEQKDKKYKFRWNYDNFRFEQEHSRKEFFEHILNDVSGGTDMTSAKFLEMVRKTREKYNLGVKIAALKILGNPHFNAEDIKKARKKLADLHPDRGGNDKDFVAINIAVDYLLRLL